MMKKQRQDAPVKKTFSLGALPQLFRVQYSVPFSLLYIFTLFYVQAEPFRPEQWTVVAASSLAVWFLLSFAYSHNEVCDVAIDRRSARRHPIAAGRISLGWAKLFAWLSGAAAVIAALATGRIPFMIAFAVVFAVLIFYNLNSKRIGLLKQLLAPALLVSIYPLCFAAVGWPSGPRAWSLAVFPVWLFLTGVGFELIKDLIDRKTDPSARLRRHPRTWRRVASDLIAGSSPLLLLPSLLGCGWIYTVGAIGTIVVACRIFRADLHRAMRIVYLECSIVGVAVVLDLLILGH